MRKGDAMNDDHLWQLIKTGDQPAFDRLYHQYAGVLFAAIYKHIPSRPDAEDLLQEVFIGLWEKRDTIAVQSSLFNYLYSMARYRTLQYIRANAVKPIDIAQLEVLLNEDPVSEKTIRSAEVAVHAAIAQLPGQMKKIYQLNTESGMPVREIADLLQLSPHTVKNHLVKVRKRLRLTVSRLASFCFTFL
ncbi:MAG TPA: sigma-70 family RNA polymerase sigma factor [Chitinophaga sp.]